MIFARCTAIFPYAGIGRLHSEHLSMFCHCERRSGCIHPYPAVRLRGLPFASSREEIADFLEARPIDIVFQERGGRPNGVAFVLLSSSDDYQQCLDKDKQNLGSRYIEVFPCARSVRYHLLLSSKCTNDVNSYQHSLITPAPVNWQCP